jgi:hypothetical protein
VEYTGDTLAALRTEITTGLTDQVDFDANFVVGAIQDGGGGGTGAGLVASAEDQDTVDVATTATFEFIRDCWKLIIQENQYVFQTANGETRSAQFLRDVQVGDKVRWTVTPALTATEVSGIATITALEADFTLPTVGDATPAPSNLSDATASDLVTGVVPTPGDDNQRDFDGAGSFGLALDATVTEQIGDLFNAIFADVYTVTITTGGLAGTARATVESASGNYRRTAVPIEATGADDGQIYIGHNVYLNFDQGGGDADAVFQVGDTYELDLTSQFDAVDNLVSGGVYGGAQDTTYQVNVTRGGVFDRVVYPIDGLQVPGVATVLNPSLAGWTGGDVDDEYMLEVTTPGNITTARFRLTSQRGDTANNIAFAGLGSINVKTVGASGLQLYFTSGGAPTFTVGDSWVVVVKASRPQVRITDSAGIDQAGTVIVNDGDIVAVGLNGVTVTIPSNLNVLGGIAATGGLAKGDRFTIAAVSSKPAHVQTLVLDSELPTDVTGGLDSSSLTNAAPDLVQLELCMVRNGVLIPEEQRDPLVAPGGFNWSAALADFTTYSDITLQDSEWVDGLGNMPYLPLESGDLYLQYRALMPTYNNVINEINDVGDVEAALGTIDPDNPLAAAVYLALLNSADGVVVRYMSVSSDDTAGYTEVLSRIETPDTVYTLVPLSRDAAVTNAVQAHVEAMSNEELKRWRIAFVSEETPSQEVAVGASTHPLNNNWLATITDDLRVVGNQYTKLEFVEDPGLLTNAAVGDVVRFSFTTDAWGNETYETGVIAEIESNKVAYLEQSLAAPVAVAERVDVIHDLSVQEQVNAIAAQAGSYASRRIYYIVPDVFIGNDNETYTAEFAAAALAGLRGSSVPQQGLTNIALNGFASVPATYNLYTPSQLDTIAGSGGLIITQEQANGEIFVRHQVSTNAATEDLNQTEMSITTNVDSIAYYFATLLKPYIGRFNVTDELVAVLRTQVESGLNYLGSFTQVGLLGPQLDLERSEILTVQRHPTLRDRILIRVNLGVPAPLNNIELYLVV